MQLTGPESLQQKQVPASEHFGLDGDVYVVVAPYARHKVVANMRMRLRAQGKGQHMWKALR